MIHIACNIDSNFTIHCGVLLISLFENNFNQDFHIHIIAPMLPKEDQEELRKITYQYNNNISFYFPPLELLHSFRIIGSTKRITLVTYYRCIIERILPESLNKVLYLDCDIIILDSILDFWNTDIDKYAIACVEDAACDNSDFYTYLHYSKEYSYFNAGVLLINLEYWRNHDMSKQCIEYFNKYPERIRINDQDLLNAILYKDKLLIPLKWNMQDGFYRNQMKKKVANLKEWKKIILKPAILHYTIKKPWNYDSFHPLNGEYFRYLKLTVWKDRHPLKSYKAKIKRMFKLIPYKLKIRKPKYLNFNP